MRKARVLVAVADRSLRETVIQRVTAAAASVITPISNGPDAFDAALREVPDLVVIAVNLPGQDGLVVCHRLRGVATFQETPIVVLGPRGDRPGKYQAFYVGATDYVEVPFDGQEFTLRLRVQLRGLLRERDAHEVLICGSLAIEHATCRVRQGERTVSLTPSEFAVLRYLATYAGRPVSVDRLLVDALRRPAGAGNPQLIHTHVRNLRKKLESDPDRPTLLVRQATGYALMA